MHKVLVGAYWELCGPHPAVLRFRASLRQTPDCSAVLGRAGSWHGRRLGRRHLAGPAARWNSGGTFTPSRVPGSPRPVTLSGCLPAPHLSVVFPPESPCLHPPSQLFPSSVCLGSLKGSQPPFLRFKKKLCVSPGQQPNAFPLFSGTKQTFSGRGRRLFPSLQHPAPSQVQNACSRAPLAWGGGLGSPG